MPLLQLTSSPTQSQGYISPRKRTVKVKKKKNQKQELIYSFAQQLEYPRCSR